MAKSKKWQTQKCFVKICSPWATIIGENIKDNAGKVLDYWRVEKQNSVIALTIQENQFVLPPPQYRPGVGKIMLDFPGGRIPQNTTPENAIKNIIQRELFVKKSDIMELTALNLKGWAINSSFSNQLLFGYTAIIKKTAGFSPNHRLSFFPINPEGISKLLGKITCLQCRGLLLEWMLNSQYTENILNYKIKKSLYS